MKQVTPKHRSPGKVESEAKPASDSTPAFIYLNNAAEGWPKAPGVVEAVSAAIRNPPSAGQRGVGNGDDPASACRRQISTLLAVPDPHRIVLTAGATHALNLAIRGLALQPGSLVIATVTEHNSVLRPLFLLEKNLQTQLCLIGLDASGSLDRAAFKKALVKRPRLVAINHASNVTGRVNEVASLFALAKDAGAVTLLDASQTVGHVPVLPLQLGADLVAFPGHKGLHGPAGTGALYVAPELDLERIIVGGTGRLSKSRSHPEHMPERLEAGTPNTSGLAGLAAALTWHDLHKDQFRQQAKQAGRCLREGLRSIRSVRLFDNDAEGERLGLASFQVDGWPVDEIGMILRESFNMACRTGLHCAPLMCEAIGASAEGTVRMSASGFNTEFEVSAAIAAVAQLAK